MKVRYDYLKDEDFLLKIDELQLKEQYTKITLLDWNEDPIEEIQGLVTGGTINLDGSSAVRRTGSISVYLKDETYANITKVSNKFSINKKIYVEIGYKNTTDEYTNYDIIWFPQGLFVINSASASRSASGTTLSLSFKDKMCLLNGDCGGIIPATTQFDEYDTIDENGNYIIEKPTIHQIILELVSHFGGEQESKILISDLDTRVKQTMRWVGSTPLYSYGSDLSKSYTTDINVAIASGLTYATHTYGDDCGYIYTDFTYPDELIAQPGETVVTILDKIKSVLGNFEYYYDIDGNFVFQEIRNYLNTSQSTYLLSNNCGREYYVYDMIKGKADYNFVNSKLITSYSNSPQYNQIKNDYVIWGTRKTDENISLPIRYHLAIDDKPAIGNTYQVFMYDDPDDGIRKAKLPTEYATINSFPSIGVEGNLYKDLQTGIVYKWVGSDNGYEILYIPLPSGYTRVEYIKTNGNQYINSGVKLSTNYRIETEVQWTAGITHRQLFGANSPTMYWGIDTDYHYEMGESTSIEAPTAASTTSYDNIIVTNINGSANVKINGTIQANRTGGSASTSNHFICKLDIAGYNASCQLKYYRMYDNNTLVRYFIPCYNSSNVIGLYDLVEGTFYINAGSGSFEKGDDVDNTISLTSITTTDWRTELYLQGVVAEPLGLDSNYYYTELATEWPKLYDIEAGAFKEDVSGKPSSIDYFLDFIDTNSAMGELSVNTIGRRSYCKNESDINCIFEGTIPDVILIELGQSDTETRRAECEERGQNYSQVDSAIYSKLATGGVYNSAYEEVLSQLYQHTGYNESIQIQMLPIYHLEPNTRITVMDTNTNINGDYIIKSISIPLTASGTSSISANRALNQR